MNLEQIESFRVDRPTFGCLPMFYLSGVSKTGSTALYNYLNQHPQLSVWPPKEKGFWGRSISTNSGSMFAVYLQRAGNSVFNSSKFLFDDSPLYWRRPFLREFFNFRFADSFSQREKSSLRFPKRALFSHYASL
jgi:hypothetical protein